MSARLRYLLNYYKLFIDDKINFSAEREVRSEPRAGGVWCPPPTQWRVISSYTRSQLARLILRWHLPNEALTADPANTFTAICNHLSRLVPAIFGGWIISQPASRVACSAQIWLSYLILRLNLPLVTPGMCCCRCGRCGAVSGIYWSQWSLSHSSLHLAQGACRQQHFTNCIL